MIDKEDDYFSEEAVQERDVSILHISLVAIALSSVRGPIQTECRAPRQLQSRVERILVPGHGLTKSGKGT